jgi:hypothetical protein
MNGKIIWKAATNGRFLDGFRVNSSTFASGYYFIKVHLKKYSPAFAKDGNYQVIRGE